MTIMWFKNLYNSESIGSIFGCNGNIVGTIIKWWAPQFHEVGCQLARLPLDKTLLKDSYPQSYKDLNFSNFVATVIDGTDVMSQTVRKVKLIIQHFMGYYGCFPWVWYMSLLTLSLLKAVPGNFERYRLHDLLDEYATYKLKENKESTTR